MKALLIPVEGSLEEIELTVGDTDASLAQLQDLVGGGFVEAIPLPGFLDRSGRSAGYINEDGKYREDLKPNMRATDLLVPGIGLFYGDYIAGPLLLCGFDPATGEHAELPANVTRLARLIEREAA